MGKLVSREIYEMIDRIPENEFDLSTISRIFSEIMVKVADEYGIVFKSATSSELERKSNQVKSTRNLFFFENGEDCYEYEKKQIFNTGNGEFVTIVGATTDNSPWDVDKEEDFYILARLFFMIFGRARAMSNLKRLAFTDYMTGVANEEQLYKYMCSKLATGTFGSYCSNFINIKNMKLFNTKYGNKLGDRIITQYAKKLEQNVGDAGCVARLGGDNFLVFIESEKEIDFLKNIETLPVEFNDQNNEIVSVEIDSRIGYCHMKPESQISDAMDHSSIALMMAKRNTNPDTVMYEEEMKIEMMKLKQLEDSIPKALANEEFVVYYQPKADISDLDNFKLSGAEALVRWNKDGVMVPPMEFIPIMEKNGYVIEIDYYVLEKVCKHLKEWEEKGLNLTKVSVNFSRRHLRNSDFADTIEEIISKYDINPKYLEVEITESYDVEDIEALKVFEQRMHKLGIALSVDDFGSGFSSLKMIKNISADIIKLDKSIIDGIGNGSVPDEIIVSNIIRMIKGLGKGVIAEGVEHVEQAKFLTENGCDFIQGYLYKRPIPKDEFEKML